MADGDVITNFSKAFYSKFVGSGDFFNAVTGRLFENQAPDETVFPYASYQIVSAPKEKWFSEEYTNIYLQLSIFSSKASSAEVKLAYFYANELLDETALTITGSTLVWMKETNFVLITDEHTTPSGTQKVWAAHIDYEIKVSLN